MFVLADTENQGAVIKVIGVGGGGVKQQDADEMRNIRVSEIFEIRYLSGNQAAGRYGAGHEAGAILIKTNRLIKQ